MQALAGVRIVVRMFTTENLMKLPETAIENTRKMFDDATKQADELRTKFETIVKNGFDMENLDLPKFDIPGVDSDKLEADVRSFVENVMGFTLVTRRELSDLEDRVEKAEKALAKKTTVAKKAAPRKAAKKPAAKRKTVAKVTASAK